MASSPGDTMYAIQDVPGKGKGLIATREIARGTRILAEEPILRFHHFELDPVHVGLEAFLSLFARRVEALSSEKRRQFFALYNPMAHVPFMKYTGVLGFNGIVLDTTFSVSGHAFQTTQSINVGIFHLASRINHDCQSNTYTSWNDKAGRYTIHALRDIAKGEEITMDYIKPYIPRHERQAYLRETYDFDCTCRLCTLPPQQSGEHDKLMVEFQRHKDTTEEHLITLQSLGVPPLCFLPSGALHKAMIPDLAQCLGEVD